MRKGFSLIEIIIAVAIIIVALAASISLIAFSVSGIRTGKAKIVAAGLAQEGIEIVRSIRDSNWMAGTGVDWRTGLIPNGYRDYVVQYDDTALQTYSGAPPKLKIENGFYQYDSDPNTETPFTRIITIENAGADQIKVISEVTWDDGNVKAEALFYNWY